MLCMLPISPRHAWDVRVLRSTSVVPIITIVANASTNRQSRTSTIETIVYSFSGDVYIHI